ncbi:hypothetical protein BTVI_86105 [Pitangus sulphuratus]|nr:hypothetical protein BTVI_86105 [Pitangus sulphuratus]
MSKLFQMVKTNPKSVLLVELSTNKTKIGFKSAVKTYLENGVTMIFRLRLGLTTESQVWNQPLTHRLQLYVTKRVSSSNMDKKCLATSELTKVVNKEHDDLSIFYNIQRLLVIKCEG